MGISDLALSPPNKDPMRVFPLWRTSKEVRVTCEPGLATPNTIVFPQPWEREIRLYYQLLFSAPYHTQKTRSETFEGKRIQRAIGMWYNNQSPNWTIPMCCSLHVLLLQFSLQHAITSISDQISASAYHKKFISASLECLIKLVFLLLLLFTIQINNLSVFYIRAQVHQAWAHPGSSVHDLISNIWV